MVAAKQKSTLAEMVLMVGMALMDAMVPVGAQGLLGW